MERSGSITSNHFSARMLQPVAQKQNLWFWPSCQRLIHCMLHRLPQTAMQCDIAGAVGFYLDDGEAAARYAVAERIAEVFPGLHMGIVCAVEPGRLGEV